MPNPGEFGYELWWTDDTGARLGILDDVFAVSFLRVTNGLGRMTMRIPADKITPQNVARDQMIQVWRKPRGGSSSLFRTFLIRKWRFQRRGSDLQTLIFGPCVNDLLRRRNVINFAGTAGAEKTDEADDMAKEVIDEQSINDTSDPAADFGSRTFANFTIAADVTLGPSISKGIAWRRAIDVMTDISEASRLAGNEVFWDVADIVSSNSIAFEFRTKQDQPGQDLTDRVVFDEARGNLEESAYTFDATNEISYVYAGGKGLGVERDIQQSWDEGRINASQYNRCEGFAYASFADEGNSVLEAANAAVARGRPLVEFTANGLDVEGTRFGVRWNWGDKVTARFLGFEFQPIVRKVMLRLSEDGRESIDARLELLEVTS
jgi:hypothetical protein